MREQHVNPEEAVQIFLDCGAELALGSHYGTFQLTDEGIDEPVTRLRAVCAERGIAAEKFRALEPGQFIEL
jgi:L-ascorbate metabolism protein UlaG (beta-lactamase superfamily)